MRRTLGRTSNTALAALCLLALIGCGANVTVEIDPDPAVPGQPVEVTVSVENTFDCPLDPTVAQVLVVAENAEITPITQSATTSGFLDPTPGDELEFFCELLQDPTLALCEVLIDQELNGDLPPEVPEFCCENETFAEQNPDLCDSGQATVPSPEALRETVIAKARELGLPVDDILARQSPATTSGGSACMTVFEEPGFALLECDLGAIAAGATATASGTFTPTIPGRYFSFVFVQGDAACADGLISGGTDCGISFVAASTMAPAMSPGGLVTLILGLAAVGALAIRIRRRAAR